MLQSLGLVPARLKACVLSLLYGVLSRSRKMEGNRKEAKLAHSLRSSYESGVPLNEHLYRVAPNYTRCC
jgi:hypothetical protein